MSREENRGYWMWGHTRLVMLLILLYTKTVVRRASLCIYVYVCVSRLSMRCFGRKTDTIIICINANDSRTMEWGWRNGIGNFSKTAFV